MSAFTTCCYEIDGSDMVEGRDDPCRACPSRRVKAGYRILAPGEMDRETLEAAAKVAERTYAKDAFRFELNTATAAAIRALGGGEG